MSVYPQQVLAFGRPCHSVRQNTVALSTFIVFYQYLKTPNGVLLDTCNGPVYVLFVNYADRY